MRKTFACAIGGVTLLAVAAPAWARHAFAAEFDADKPANFRGTVKNGRA